MSNAFKNTVITNADTKISFSGADIKVVIGTKEVGSIQALSYSVTREKGPWYTMRGTANPGGFARGKRAVGGTLVFLTLDQQSLINHMRDVNYDKSYLPKADTRFDYSTKNDINDVFGLTRDAGVENVFADEDLFSEDSGLFYDREYIGVDFADQLLPFDVHASASNEYGHAMKKSIIAIEILNEGGGVSIDDLVIEEQYTYMAKSMTPWTKIQINTKRNDSQGR